MPLNIVRDDLVNMRADAVVLPFNERLAVDGGAGGAVAKKAGLLRVRRACRKVGGCPVGSAVSTPAFSFPAKYLVHAVGPVWNGEAGAARLLRSVYDSALEAAAQLGCESVAMPLLSAGSFGCPAHVSLSIALSSIEEFLADNGDMQVTLVLFDKKAVAAGLDFLGDLESRIDDAYAEAFADYGTAVWGDASYGRPNRRAAVPTEPTGPIEPIEPIGPIEPDSEAYPALASAAASALPPVGASAPQPSYSAASPFFRDADSALDATAVLEQRFSSMDDGFSQTLLALIDASGMTDAQVYRRANMSRQHFSKIRSNVGYRPSKATVLALCIALELDLAQTGDLLASAGFALSHASKFDIVIEYFIERGMYDQFKINEALFYFDQPLLGG